MAKNESAKGNPATKRIGNLQHKACRAKCWARGEARKKARREAQDAREAANRAAGTTQWKIACVARQARRSL